MKRKSDLKRKVLCSLLAASTMGIFYSSDALAATVNGEKVPETANGIITDDWLVNQAKSKKFVIAQGDKLVIATEGNVNSLITGIKTALENDKLGETAKLNAIREVLAENSVVGVVGGEGQLDTGITAILNTIKTFYEGDPSVPALPTDIKEQLGSIMPILDRVNNINTVGNNVNDPENDIKFDEATNLVIGNDTSSPVVIGLVGGDLSVNTGLKGNLTVGLDIGEGNTLPMPMSVENSETAITRNNDVNILINSGNVLGGVGGSVAAALGNISVDGNIKLDVEEGEVAVNGIEIDLDIDGKTTTTIYGDINTATSEGSTANIGAFANGGAAVAIGGTADSIVNGNSNLIIDSNVNAKGGLDGITAGVAGGGVALTTIGGTANSEVNGNVNIGINNGLAIGVVGGGVAGAADATGAVEAIKGGQVGNDDGTSGLTLEELKTLLGGDKAPDFIKNNITGFNATVNEAIRGGEATATVKGDTNISLTGNTTAIGVIGGGVAAASHTYTWKNDGTNSEAGLGEDDVNKAYGSSTAKADTGKATIVVDLKSPDKGKVAANIGGALSSVISAVKDGDLSKINAEGVVGQGAAVGVFGGGVAFGHGTLRGSMDAENGATATATTDGADIYLQNGYAAGVFGGGAAVALNNAKAVAGSSDVYIGVGSGMKAIGVFGGGLALSMEGKKGDDGVKVDSSGTLASSTVNSNDIEIYGDVDGVFGGGMAIGNSLRNGGTEGVDDAVSHVGTANIIVNNGTVSNLNLDTFMKALKNDNKDGWPQWSVLGFNASGAMVDLKGITDETSIAAGGLGLGMSGKAEVDTANVTINGGTIEKDILGGGIAVDNLVTEKGDKKGGAHVGTSKITLNGGSVEGSVYAGGAVNGTTPNLVKGKIDANKVEHGYDASGTSSTVDKATVVLNGTKVKGEISGQGYKLTTKYGKPDNYNPYHDDNTISYDKAAYDSVTESNLIITGNNTLKPLDSEGAYTGTSKIHSFDNINVAADSVTTLDSSLTAGNTTALIDGDGGVITVADGAKLDISKLAVDKTNSYLVASDYADDSSLWANDALIYDRTENYAEATDDENGYKVSYKDLSDLTEEEQDKAVNDFVDSLDEGGENFEGTINGIIRNGDNTFAGAKEFFKDASSTGDNSGLAAMAMIGEADGVTAGTINVAGDMADNSVLRLSFTQDDITGEPAVNEDGAVWAKYIHSKHDLDGMASSFGSIDSSSDFDGATVGVDFAKKGKVQSGIAFSYGDGDSHGMGINNDFDMWGLTLYGNVKNDDTNVIADIGFSESDNELTGKAMGKDIKADRDVSVFTVGVRAEKMYTNGSTQIVPYTGLRYYNVDPDSYTAYYDGAKFAEYDAERQNIWTLPVGVSLRNETVTESGWKIVPQANVAYIWAFGDTDNSVDLNTGSGMDTLDYTVMDSGSWLGSLGIEAGKDDWNFGLGYSYQKGSHAEANKWFVNVEYSF